MLSSVGGTIQNVMYSPISAFLFEDVNSSYGVNMMNDVNCPKVKQRKASLGNATFHAFCDLHRGVLKLNLLMVSFITILNIPEIKFNSI